MELVAPICKVPLCSNEPLTSENWPICSSCMRNTVRRFLHAEGSWDINSTEPPTSAAIEKAAFWMNYILVNIESLCTQEKQTIALLGENYDRDGGEKLVQIVLEFE